MVEVQVHEPVGEGMAQTLGEVETLVGIWHGKIALDETVGNLPAQHPGAGDVEDGLRFNSPKVVFRVPVEGLAGKLIGAVNVERRDEVLFEILVLVVTKDDHRVGFEIVNGLPNFLESGPMLLPMHHRSFQLMLPLVLHGRRPVLGVLHVFRDLAAG